MWNRNYVIVFLILALEVRIKYFKNLQVVYQVNFFYINLTGSKLYLEKSQSCTKELEIGIIFDNNFQTVVANGR